MEQPPGMRRRIHERGNTMKSKNLLLAIIASLAMAAHGGVGLKPLMDVPDQVVLKTDFSTDGLIDKAVWQPRQGTRWAIEDGVLRGRESPEEFQAKKKDHRGLEPRISCPATPAEFVAAFSVCFKDGAPSAIVPFVEFGHHVLRIRFREDGVDLIADHESVQLAKAADFKWETGKWYHALAELKGDEFVIQFTDGPTLYAKHPCIAQPAPSGGAGLGLAGPVKGLAELDNVTLWTVKGEQPGWAKTRKAMPIFTPVQLKEKPAEGK